MTLKTSNIVALGINIRQCEPGIGKRQGRCARLFSPNGLGPSDANVCTVMRLLGNMNKVLISLD